MKFFSTLPSIEDPFDLRRPEFAVSTTTNAGDWLTSLKQQVANQFRAIKANPGMSGFAAAFTSPMLITGGADVYSQFVSQFVFSGRVQIKISTDGKFLIVGQLPVPRRTADDERQGLRRPVADLRGRGDRASSSPTSPTTRGS